MANACSALVAFYAVRLWEAVPAVAPPSLDIFAVFLQVKAVVIRQATYESAHISNRHFALLLS